MKIDVVDVDIKLLEAEQAQEWQRRCAARSIAETRQRMPLAPRLGSETANPALVRPATNEQDKYLAQHG
jgi:hypothetical protein